MAEGTAVLETSTNILTSISTKKNNIEGILYNLSSIMDRKSYNDLYRKFSGLSKEIPNNEILTEDEKKIPNFTNDLQYTDLWNKLRSFEEELSKYEDFKKLSDSLNELNNSTNDFQLEKISLNDYFIKNKKFIDLFLITKENPYSKQFTKFIDNCNETIFISLKELALIDDDSLIKYINKTNSQYLIEAIGSKIRESIDVREQSGSLSEDNLNKETLKKCALIDKNIISKKEEMQRSKEREIEEIKNVDNSYKRVETDLESNKDTINELKRERKNITFKSAMTKFVIIPSLVIPLSMPFIGLGIGQKKSKENLLTKTITQVVDMNTMQTQNSVETFESTSTGYVASVTICNQWKKNLSGNSYSRICNVYDYDLYGLSDDFRLNLDNIEEERLNFKYEYEESSNIAPEERYLKEKQLYVTETFQTDEKIPNEKYIIKDVVSGSGLALATLATEALLYYKYNENIAYFYNKMNNDKNEIRNSLLNAENEKEKLEKEKSKLEEKKRKLKR